MNSKTVDFNPNILIITLNKNGLNTANKNVYQTAFFKKQDHYLLLQETSFEFKKYMNNMK